MRVIADEPIAEVITSAAVVDRLILVTYPEISVAAVPKVTATFVRTCFAMILLLPIGVRVVVCSAEPIA
jgi:hypothetical protein